MNCRSASKKISPYLDGALAPGEKEELRAHLDSCVSCRANFAELSAVHDLLATVPRFSAPAGFSARVTARLEESERRKGWWRWWDTQPMTFRALEGAFAVLVVAIGLVFGSFLTASRPPAPVALDLRHSFALDTFAAVPPGSIGGMYASFTEVGHEE
jgi:anti-sigma factor RsiW